jgi:hypothetical protein
MTKDQKLQIIEEIKRMERELYLMKTRLSVLEALELNDPKTSVVDREEDKQKWKKTFSELIKLIGDQSVGGNSVEEIKTERER